MGLWDTPSVARYALGPFDLLRPLGQGGMGVVWHGRHRTDGTEVAIKWVAGSEVDAPAFLREAEAMARLHHPHIVQIYDLGRMPESARVEGAGVGAPYLVMELLPEGTLVDHGGVIGWSGMRNVLLVLLDALAHAHARGLLHRDLKPANVLRDRDGSWRLADFGIARAAHAEGRAAGTPAYMAPELLQGRDAEAGPWSDLYALGALAWQLATGRTPVAGASPAEVLARSLASSWGPWAPRVAVPEGLRAWAERLLQPDFERRFERAADAALALQALGEPVEQKTGTVADLAPAATFVLDEPVAAPLATAGTAVPEAVRFPACPREWRHAGGSVPLPQNLGLGLFGLREVPFVGRYEERSALWRELVLQHDGRGPRVVWLTGDGGIGVTRTARWLAERADELGLAQHWSGDLSLRAMVRAAVPISTHPSMARAQLASRLGVAPTSPRVATWLAWLGDEALPPYNERVALVAQLLTAESRRRPILVHADASERLDEILALSEHVRATPDARVLFLISAKAPPAGADAVHALRPMKEVSLRGLVGQVLGIEHGLAVDLAHRAAGSPRVVLDALARAVAHGALVPGPDGYRLVGDVDWQADEDELFRDRVDADDGVSALAVGAVLGTRVDASEWRRACALAEVPVPEGVLDQSFRRGWLVPVPEGFRFAEPRLQRALKRQVRHAGAWATLQAAAGRAIDAERDPARAARHLLAAGLGEEALEPLRQGAQQSYGQGDLAGAALLYARLVEVLDALGREATLARADALGWQSWVAVQRARFEEATRMADEALALGERLGEPGVVGSARHTRGVARAELGLPGAEEDLIAASEGYAAAGQQRYAVRARLTAWLTRPPAEALEPLRALYEAHAEDEPLAGSLSRMIAVSLGALGDREGALRWAETAAAHAREVGGVAAERQAAVAVGDARLELGDLDGAERAYRWVIEQAVDDQDGRNLEAELSLGLVDLERGAFQTASQRLRRCARRWRAVAELGLHAAAMLAVFAHEGDTQGFDEYVGHAMQPVEPPRRAVRSAEIAAGLWRDRGDEARAERALALALHHAEASGLDLDAARVREQMT
ncbi:MAG: serine/threonine protein kinase [Deltaproteobacteria bacterium]|nr:MAG: serine/threonine protein kinase [Deltaproteobacteria bacterium]